MSSASRLILDHFRVVRRIWKEPTASDTENARAHRAVQKNDGLGKITLAKREKTKSKKNKNCSDERWRGNGEDTLKKWQGYGSEIQQIRIPKAGPSVAFAPEMIQLVILRWLQTRESLSPNHTENQTRETKTGFTWFGKIAVVVRDLRKKITNKAGISRPSVLARRSRSWLSGLTVDTRMSRPRQKGRECGKTKTNVTLQVVEFCCFGQCLPIFFQNRPASA